MGLNGEDDDENVEDMVLKGVISQDDVGSSGVETTVIGGELS